MQTDTADASNSKQKRQHWRNSNQIIKKSLIANKKTHYRDNRGKSR